jgi:hypothetical protein
MAGVLTPNLKWWRSKMNEKDYASEIDLRGGGDLVVLYQVGPISKKVCELSFTLLRLAKKCYEPESYRTFTSVAPSTSATYTNEKTLAARSGTGHHKSFFEILQKAKGKELPSNVEIKDVASTQGVSNKESEGIDIKWVGKDENGRTVVAGWDLTTAKGLGPHLDKYVKMCDEGWSPPRKESDLNEEEIPSHEEEPGKPDTASKYTSFIGISY